MGKYDAYIEWDRPVSKKYGRMTRQNRAKQFAPFAAVKGLDQAVRNKEQVFVSRPVLSEEWKEEINRNLSALRKEDGAFAVYYSCGQYLQLSGVVTGIDRFRRFIRIEDTEIDFDDLLGLDIIDMDSAR